MHIDRAFKAQAKYGDIWDILSDFLVEDVVKQDPRWEKNEAAAKKLVERRNMFIHEMGKAKYFELDERLVAYAKASRKKAAKAMKKACKGEAPTEKEWGIYNGILSRSSDALLAKATKLLNKRLSNQAYKAFCSYVGTRYWQVASGWTREQLNKTYGRKVSKGIKEMLGACWSEYSYGESQEQENIDSWWTECHRADQTARDIYDIDKAENSMLSEVNELVREMIDMEHMSEKTRRKICYARREFFVPTPASEVRYIVGEPEDMNHLF